MITYQGYSVADPDALETPAMLLFQDQMDHNLRYACEIVDGGQNLIAHVKTHKSEAVTRKQLNVGIDGFKCSTLNELAMVLKAGAGRAILAYPQLQQRKIERFCDLASSYPDAWIATIVSDPLHVAVLGKVASRRKQSLRVMLDLEAGMGRTGIDVGPDAEALYREIDTHGLLQPSGLHMYDGHEDYSDQVERRVAAQRHIDSLRDFRHRLESAGMAVPCVVGGGSFSFLYYARTDDMYGSPGTFIYWDSGYTAAMPDMPFRWAALILTQVVDRHRGAGTITTDLGSKAICADLPVEDRAYLLGHEQARLVHQSEEHGVFRIADDLPDVGEYLLVAPGHVCPTTICYPGSHVVAANGEVVDYFEHTARDRG